MGAEPGCHIAGVTGGHSRRADEPQGGLDFLNDVSKQSRGSFRKMFYCLGSHQSLMKAVAVSPGAMPAHLGISDTRLSILLSHSAWLNYVQDRP